MDGIMLQACPRMTTLEGEAPVIDDITNLSDEVLAELSNGQGDDENE